MRKLGYRFAAPAALAVLAALLASACSIDQPEAPRLDMRGSEVLARYVAIGDGLTAGFMDAALMIDGQATSVPALLARQMGHETALAGMEFAQPYLASPGVGSTELPPGTPGTVAAGTLYLDGSQISVATFSRSRLVPGDMLLAATVPRPYNNLGIPGALAPTLLSVRSGGDPGGNPFFDLILRNSNPLFGNTTAVQQAIGMRPTLVSVWVGFTEILAGARSGEPAYGGNPAAGHILPPAAFATALGTMVAALVDGVEASTGVAPVVVLANVPPVTSLPFFVPAAAFSQIYPPGYVEEASLVLFTALSWIQVPGNAGQPVPAVLTLDAAEVAVIEGAVAAYNAAIAEVAAEHDLAVVDVHAEIAGWSAAQRTHFLLLLQPPASLTPAQAARTTLFSLDGLHPNNRGYAVLANAFIETINEAAGAALAPIDVTSVTWDPVHGMTVQR